MVTQGEVSGKEGRRVLSKALIFLGALMVIAGLSLALGTILFLRATDRRYRESQEELFRAFQEGPWGDGEGQRVSILPGDALARITAPTIGLDAMVVELSGLDDTENLKKGPGHVPGTALPGEVGNCVVSGHRTTYGAPFRDLDRLEPGDPIYLETRRGSFEYRVVGRKVVLPQDLGVLEPTPEPTLTLTACHPRYSASRRLVVTAVLAHEGPVQ
jgi:sortase A